MLKVQEREGDKDSDIDFKIDCQNTTLDKKEWNKLVVVLVNSKSINQISALPQVLV